MRRLLTPILILALFVGAILALDHAAIQPAVVLKVVDGDTLHLAIDGKRTKVRLHGIDTPERDQPHGSKATAALLNLVYNRDISVKKRDTDRYGRLVAIIYADGENVNTALVRDGHAWWYRRYAQLSVPLAWAEFEARNNDRGLWQAEDPTPPWEWRRARRSPSRSYRAP